jgi:hypothetical protein
VTTDWNTRLAVRYKDEQGTEHEISPINSFTPTLAANAEPIHSIERTHVGVVFNPQAITFQMSVSAIGDSAARLTALAINRLPFTIMLQEKTGDDWSFNSIVLSDCVITSAGPTNASPTGVPQATFSGFSMHIETTAADNTKSVGPVQSGG